MLRLTADDRRFLRALRITPWRGGCGVPDVPAIEADVVALIVEKLAEAVDILPRRRYHVPDRTGDWTFTVLAVDTRKVTILIGEGATVTLALSRVDEARSAG